MFVAGGENSRSVEKVLPPFFIAVSDQAHQLPRRMQCERTRTALELQAGLLGRAVTLAVIAGVAGSNQILPG